MKNAIVICLLLAVTAPLCRRVSAESLWQKRSRAFEHIYTDDKARTVGDVITVIIVESIKQNDSEKSELDRTTKTTSELTDLKWFRDSKLDASLFKTLPKAGWNSDKEFEGEGKFNASASYETRLTAVVREVLPNGSLIIEGKREIKIGEDIKKIVLTGIIRPNDISPDNTIYSQYIANMKLYNDGKGPVNRTRRRGWLDNILDIVWPF